MTEEWKKKTLGDIANIKGGKRLPKGKKLSSEPTEYPYIRVTDFNDFGSIDTDQIQFISEEIYEQIKNYTISDQDLYISIAGTIGKSGIVPKELNGANLTENACKLVFNENIDNRFIYYFTQSLDFLTQAGLNTRTAAMPKLALSRLATINLLIPELHKQKQIVSILDKAFESINQAIVNVEKNLKNTKELFESKLNDVFSQKGEGWEEKTISEITSLLGDGLHGTPKYTEDGEYYFINGNNLNNGKIVFKDKTKKVSFEEYEKYKKKLNERTVFVSINGTLGNVAFYENEKVILGKSACYFNLIDGIDKNFIKYLILSPYFVNYANTVATGATIKNVSLKSMRTFTFHIPNTLEQQAIVKKLNHFHELTQALESKYNQVLNSLDELKKSILEKAFSGELLS